MSSTETKCLNIQLNPENLQNHSSLHKFNQQIAEKRVLEAYWSPILGKFHPTTGNEGPE